MRNLVKSAIAGLCLAILSGVSAFGYTGEAGPPMLKMIFGSRALSMGGAYVGLCDDIFYMDANPAGGDHRSVLRIAALHQEWIADTNYESFRISRGFNDQFYLGFGFTYLYLPFVYYDMFGDSGGQSHNLSQSLGILNGGYHFRGLDLTVGANAKVYYYYVPEDLVADQSFALLSFDVGVLKKTNLLKSYVGPEPSLCFGLAVRNVGFSNAVDKLPLEVHTGASYRPIRPLLISTEVALPFFEPIYGGIGVEYDFAERYYINGGVQIKANPMFAAGFGYRRKDLRINVSYTPTLAFYNMMSITVSYAFGEYKRQQESEKIEQLLQEAFDLFAQGKYDKALDAVERVLEMDPKNGRALNLKETIVARQKLHERARHLENE